MKPEEILKKITEKNNDKLNDYLEKKWSKRIEKLLSFGHKPENLILLNLNELEKYYEVSLKMEKEDLEQKKKIVKELEKKGEKITYASKIEKDGKIYEQIYDYESKKSQFIHYNSNGITKEEQIDGIFPIEDEVLEKGVVVLPSDAIEYENEEKLIEEIKNHIKKYLDIPDEYLTYATYYILLTWVYEKVNTIPYLRALGDTGSGKSRFLRVIGDICYKPIRTSGTITPAPIYRLIEKWKGTMLIEESDRKQSDTSDEIIKILNCGFERGNAVLRCDKESPDTIQVHEVFCPKIITSRFRFSDKALEARCLTNVMQETDRKDIPYLLGKDYEEETEKIRNKLLMFRLKNWEKVGGETEAIEIINKYDLSGIEPRLKQVATPFFILLKNDNIAKPFIDFIKNYNKILIEERSETIEGQIVNIIYEYDEKGELLSSKDIADKLNSELPKNATQYTPQKIGKYLKSLGITTVQERNEEGRVRRIIKIDNEIKNRLYNRYCVEKKCSIVASVATHIGEPQHATIDIEEVPATYATNDTGENKEVHATFATNDTHATRNNEEVHATFATNDTHATRKCKNDVSFIVDGGTI